jgi:hypothetical protein
MRMGFGKNGPTIWGRGYSGSGAAVNETACPQDVTRGQYGPAEIWIQHKKGSETALTMR